MYKKLYKDKKKLIGKNGKLLRLTLPERVQANGSPLFGIASVIVSVKRNKIEKKIKRNKLSKKKNDIYSIKCQMPGQKINTQK